MCLITAMRVRPNSLAASCVVKYIMNVIIAKIRRMLYNYICIARYTIIVYNPFVTVRYAMKALYISLEPPPLAV